MHTRKFKRNIHPIGAQLAAPTNDFLLSEFVAMDRTAPVPEPIVLLIEPDPAARQLYTRALRRRWRVIAVRNVSEALAALGDEEAPQAAVIEPYAGSDRIDWQGLTGLRDRLANQHMARQAVPVILCSTVDERGMGYDWGAAAYLLKPVSPEQLVGELTRVLA
jgi:DNA-binding response OmpR family regulator